MIHYLSPVSSAFPSRDDGAYCITRILGKPDNELMILADLPIPHAGGKNIYILPHIPRIQLRQVVVQKNHATLLDPR
jgi:hypothetical protein